MANRPPARYARYRDLEFAEAARAYKTPEIVEPPAVGSARTGILRVEYRRQIGPVYSYTPGVPIRWILGTIDWPHWDRYHQRVQAMASYRNQNNTAGAGWNTRFGLETVDAGVEQAIGASQGALPADASESLTTQSELLAGTGVRAVLTLTPTGLAPGSFQFAIQGSLVVRLVDARGSVFGG